MIWGGEFGRTPTVSCRRPGSNAGKINGRDHNHHGFTMWMAGGGVKGGYVHGATDEFGFQAWKRRSTSTTCTPRCCSCWVSITRS